MIDIKVACLSMSSKTWVHRQYIENTITNTAIQLSFKHLLNHSKLKGKSHS